jgi:dTDP-4-amino-4,6-dideoxygalactose transaminase
MKVGFAAPDITQDDVDAVANAVSSGWLTTGPNAEKLEVQLAALTGRPFVKVTSSLTAAIPPLLSVLPHFNDAAFPAWTFSSVPMEFLHAGIEIVFKDIDPYTFMLDPTVSYEEDVIVPTHFGGNRLDLCTLWLNNKKKTLIDDAAHVLPFRDDSPTVATLYSFYATKPLCAGEGGAVSFRAPDLAQKFSSARLHGFTKDAFDRYTNPAAELYDIKAPGWKANMSDMHAALALSQLTRVFDMVMRRRQIINQYREALPQLGWQVMHHDDYSDCHLAVVILPQHVNRAKFRQALGARDIATSVHFTPLYRFDFWAHHLYSMTASQFVQSGQAKAMFPVCEAYAEKALSLPLSSTMTDDQVAYVIESIKAIMEDA